MEVGDRMLSPALPPPPVSSALGHLQPTLKTSTLPQFCSSTSQQFTWGDAPVALASARSHVLVLL